jgi:hypothetical protein
MRYVFWLSVRFLVLSCICIVRLCTHISFLLFCILARCCYGFPRAVMRCICFVMQKSHCSSLADVPYATGLVDPRETCS